MKNAHLEYDSVYVTFQKMQNYMNRKEIGGCQGLEIVVKGPLRAFLR